MMPRDTPMSSPCGLRPPKIAGIREHAGDGLRLINGPPLGKRGASEHVDELVGREIGFEQEANLGHHGAIDSGENRITANHPFSHQ